MNYVYYYCLKSFCKFLSTAVTAVCVWVSDRVDTHVDDPSGAVHQQLDAVTETTQPLQTTTFIAAISTGRLYHLSQRLKPQGAH